MVVLFQRAVYCLCLLFITACAHVPDRSPLLLQAQLGQLQPAGKPAVYLISVAAWDGEPVFANEMRLASDYFGRRYQTGGRNLQLSNARWDQGTLPQASLDLLQQAIAGVAAKMNKEQDILALYMVSHGLATGQLAIKPPFGDPLSRLSAGWLQYELDKAGIRWRMVFVSACYSGEFANVLSNARTLVVTASDADNPSFGCGEQFTYTVFGDALIAQHNQPEFDHLSWQALFVRTQQTILARENALGLNQHSNPQFFQGDAIKVKLEALPPAP